MLGTLTDKGVPKSRVLNEDSSYKVDFTKIERTGRQQIYGFDYVEGEENENEEKERQDGVGRVVGSQKEGKRSVW